MKKPYQTLSSRIVWSSLWYRIRHLTYINHFYAANGICSEVGPIFLATGVSLGTPDHEATKVMEIHPTPLAEALHLAPTMSPLPDIAVAGHD